MSDISDKLDKLFQRGVNYEYFFRNLTSPTALPKLEEAGFFKTPLKAERKDGYVMFPRWAPIEYLIKIADKEPEKVMDLILSIPPTDNASIHVQYVEAALKMPAEISKRINPEISKWLKQIPVHSLPYVLSDLLNHYISNDEIDAALDLTKAQLQIKKPSRPEKLIILHPETIIGIHEFEELLNKQVSQLFSKRPEEISDLLIATLRKGLGIEERNKPDKDGIINDYSEIWLSDFNKLPHYSNEVNVVIAHSLFGLIKSVNNKPEIFKPLILKLSSEKYKIYLRMAAALIGEGNEDPDLAAIYDRVIKRWGEPNLFHSEFTSWTGPEGPLSVGELKAKSEDELIAYLKDWEPSEDIMSPSKDGLARILSQYIDEKPEIAFAVLRSSDVLDSVYVSHALQSLRTATDNKKKVDWEKLISELGQFAKQDLGTSESDNWLLSSAINLLESGLNQDLIDISKLANRKTIMDLVKKGLLSKDPEPEREIKVDKGGMGPDILAINSTRGNALFALVRYMKALSRFFKQDRQSLDQLPKKELEEIDRLLDRHINKETEPTLAVRTVYAHELPFLVYAHEGWVTANIDNIFPREIDVFKANVETLVLYSRPFVEVVPIVRPQLVRYMKLIKEGKVEIKDTHLSQQLIAQIMIYYLNGDIEYDDELIKQLLELPPLYRAGAIEFIGRNLRDLDLAINKLIFQRGLAYWGKRVEAGLTKEEAEHFGWWFSADGIELNWRSENIIVALHKCSNLEALWLVIETLDKLVDKAPDLVVKILLEIVKTQTEEKLRYVMYKEVKKMVSQLYASEQEAVKQQAKDIVERLLAKGFVDFKDVLKSN